MTSNRKWSLTAVVMLALLTMVAATAPAADNGESVQPDAVRIQALPDGVTAAMVEEGQGLFTSAALCFTCHGQAGEGVPNLGPNLTDDAWLNIDGTYDAIVELINTGVPAPKEHMIPMVPRAGSGIDDDQVRAVAAYVWTLTNG